jgi:hypothetical protein
MALSITLSFLDLRFHPSIKFKLDGLAYFNTKKYIEMYNNIGVYSMRALRIGILLKVLLIKLRQTSNLIILKIYQRKIQNALWCVKHTRK